MEDTGPLSRKQLLKWLKEQDVQLILFGLIILFFGWLFVETADDVLEGETKDFDNWAVMVLRDPHDLSDPIGPLWFEEAVRDISALGSFVVLFLITFSFLIFLRIIRYKRTLLFILISIAGGLTCSTALKAFFARPRPELVAHGTYVVTHSFPSGHSMMSAIVYMTLGALITEVVSRKSLKSFFLILAMFFTFIVGLSRIYLGVHYPTDVLAGWCAGFVWAALCSGIARVFALREKDRQGGGIHMEPAAGG